MKSISKKLLIKLSLIFIIFISSSLILSTFAAFDSNHPILGRYLNNLSLFPLILLGAVLEPMSKIYFNTYLKKALLLIIFMVFILIRAYLLVKINTFANL
ncbi:MAG: hypothetical protein ACRDD2_12815 [Sarcina sp.]